MLFLRWRLKHNIYLSFPSSVYIWFKLNGTLGHPKCHLSTICPWKVARLGYVLFVGPSEACVASSSCGLQAVQQPWHLTPPPTITQVFPSWRLYKDLLSEYTSTCDVAASIQIFCFEIVHFVGLVSEGESDSLQSPTYSPRCLLLGWESFTLVSSTKQIVKPLFLRPLRLLLFVDVQIHEIGCLSALSFLINSMFLEIRL